MIQVVRKFDPDELAAEGYVPKAPMCQRCGVTATAKNPIGVTRRKSWNPFDPNRSKHLDAICAKCREWLSIR